MSERTHRSRFQPLLGAAIEVEHPPGTAWPAVVLEPPYPLAAVPELWVATVGDAAWGGGQVFQSDDDDTYTYVGQLAATMTVGRLETPLDPAPAHGVVPDALVTVLLYGDRDWPAQTISQALARAGAWCVGTGPDAEILCPTMTRLLDTDDMGARYVLSGPLLRGAYGTGRAPDWSCVGWPAGTACVRVDHHVFRWRYELRHVGRPVYLKLSAQNEHAEAVEELQDTDPIIYTIAGRHAVRDPRRWL